jgi:hypothetical protein
MLGLPHSSIDSSSLLIALLRNPIWIREPLLHDVTSRIVAHFHNFWNVDEDGESALSVLFYLMLPDGKIHPSLATFELWTSLMKKSSVDLINDLRAKAMNLVPALIWSRLFRDHYPLHRPQFVAGQEEFENAALIERVMDLGLETMFKLVIGNSDYSEKR